MRKLWLAAIIPFGCLAQDHIAVPIQDPARAVTMKVTVMRGSVTIRAYNGREVLVDSKGSGSSQTTATTHDGLHRIDGGGSDMTITSQNNVVEITDHGMRNGDVTIQTPTNTTVKVKALSGGQVTIEGVSGDTEAQNLNGSLSITNVSGSVVANSLNGSVTVVLTNATPGKPMSFTSLNGKIDVTLPADVKADFAMKSMHGEIYSDFDVKLKPSGNPITEDTGKNSGRYRVKVDATVSGTVNGGGSEFQFRTMNGNIYIRKGK